VTSDCQLGLYHEDRKFDAASCFPAQLLPGAEKTAGRSIRRTTTAKVDICLYPPKSVTTVISNPLDFWCCAFSNSSSALPFGRRKEFLKHYNNFAILLGRSASESQQGKEVGEIHESLGFMPLGVSQELSTILLIQQHMQALLHDVRQPKPRQVIGDLNFDLN
jgi:hypothetical protein